MLYLFYLIFCLRFVAKYTYMLIVRVPDMIFFHRFCE